LNAPSREGSGRQRRSRRLVALLSVLGISLGLMAAGGPQASAAASCSASYTTGYESGGVFQGAFTVTNTGITVPAGWFVSFVFGGDQVISHLWGGGWTQGYEDVTVFNASYDGTVGVGASTSFGILGRYYKSDAPPVGLTCSPKPWQVSLTGSDYVGPGYDGMFTATANADVGPTPYDIQIWDATTGTEVGLCGTGTTCSVTYPTNYDASEDQIVAYIAENSTGTIPLGTAQASSNAVLVYNDV
jgi:hypothetical protein